MNEGSSSSASPSTGTTPGSAALNTNPQKAETLTEAQFLQQQAREAQQAIARTVGLIGKDLGHSVDPRAWTRSHPWLSLTSAAIGGFAVMLLIPSEEKRALRRLARIRRAVAREQSTDRDGLAGAGPSTPGFLSKLLHEVFAVARPIIISAISTAVASGRKTEGNDPQAVGDPAARDTTDEQPTPRSDPVAPETT